MRSTVLTALGLSLALTAPCLAQSTQSSTSPPASAAQPLIKGKPGTEAGRAPAAPGSQHQANAATQQENMGSSTEPQQQASNTHQPTAIQMQMKKDLEQSGFTDVTIMPESFLIRAHDKQGRPVMMVVNPDSVLAVTKMGGASKMANSANSGGSGNGATNYQ